MTRDDPCYLISTVATVNLREFEGGSDISLSAGLESTDAEGKND